MAAPETVEPRSMEDTALAEELAERGEARLHTGAFPRCTWYGMSVVRDGDPRLEQRASLAQ